ncbi:unnamed protein product [Nyctereutes procyonoides]|uniref:(raccoon dog) hypothetical protein n=1 Tax=Nyctereutes procyonoides TaxID=34880 RepID=A0A811ZNU1_NYCPR|nr:unnamed protein product [Nyctereutes procyonoides]
MLLSGHSFTTTAEQETVCDIEEKLHSVAWTWSRSWPPQPPAHPQQRAVSCRWAGHHHLQRGVLLPGGTLPAFLPHLEPSEDHGLTRGHLVALSCVPGIADTMHQITALVPNTMNIKITALPKHKSSMWMGGSNQPCPPASSRGASASKQEYESCPLHHPSQIIIIKPHT